MKRRTFILVAAATTVAVAVPIIYYTRKGKTYHPLVMPDILGSFCSESEIRDIGNSYRSRIKQEDNKEKLTELILTNNAGTKIEPSDRSAIAELVKKKTQEEFQTYQTIIVEGWVISVTEARQCALFSITTKN